MLKNLSHILPVKPSKVLRIIRSTTVEKFSVNTKHKTENSNEVPADQFTLEYQRNKIELTKIQKFILSAGASVMSVANPYRQDMVACLAETTGKRALENLLVEMQQTDEGCRILATKPRIHSTTIDIDRLRGLPKNTFGRNYVKFLDDNKVTPDSRLPVKFIDDPDLAYVMTRYRECHDMFHTILNMPIDMLSEVTVKWIEAINTKLPMCYAAAVFGAFTLSSDERKLYKKFYLPWAIKNGEKVKPLLSVYWEEKWEQDITDLRNELGVITLKY